MSHRSIAFAAALAFAPLLCQASPERDALNSCAHAFAQSFATNGANAPTFRVDYRSNAGVGSMLQFYNRAYAFDLYARDPKTGLPVARASCETDANGAVLELSARPLPEKRLSAAR